MAKEKTKKKKTENKQEKKTEYYFAYGRRKESTARVRLYTALSGKVDINGKSIKQGEMLINDRPVEVYFPGEVYKKTILEPFRTTNTVGRFAVSVKVDGGGLKGQFDAFIHAVSRALVKVDEDKFRPILRKRGFLTRDSRVKERRKAGLAQSARAKKQSPKR